MRLWATTDFPALPAKGGSPASISKTVQPEAVLVAPGVDRLAAGRLLRAHVIGGPDHEAELGERRVGVGSAGGRLGYAEIGDHARGRRRGGCSPA